MMRFCFIQAELFQNSRDIELFPSAASATIYFSYSAGQGNSDIGQTGPETAVLNVSHLPVKGQNEFIGGTFCQLQG